MFKALKDSALSCEDEFFNLIYLNDLKRNDRVWSYNPKTRKTVCSRVIGKETLERELESFLIFKVADDFESSVKMTSDHLLYVLKNKKPTRTIAKNVKIGDVLITKFGDFPVQIIQESLNYPVRCSRISL